MFETPRVAKIGGVVAVAFGAVFGLSGLAGGSIGVAVLVGVFGLLFVMFGLLAVRARVTVTPGMLIVRNWRTVYIGADELLDLQPGSVGWYGRGTVLIARRTSRRPVKLFALNGSAPRLAEQAQAQAILLALRA